MILDRHTVVDVLTPLSKASREAEKRMSLIAAIVTEIPLKTQLVQQWQSHAACSEELQEKIRVQGVAAKAEEGEVIASVLKRRPRDQWVSLSEKRLLEVAVRIEKELLQQYREALSKELPVDVRMLLERHQQMYEKNQASRRRVSAAA